MAIESDFRRIFSLISFDNRPSMNYAAYIRKMGIRSGSGESAVESWNSVELRQESPASIRMIRTAVFSPFVGRPPYQYVHFYSPSALLYMKLWTGIT